MKRTARKTGVARPAFTGAWRTDAPFDGDVDEVLREVSRLRSKLNREIRPTDIVKLMQQLGWKKMEATE